MAPQSLKELAADFTKLDRFDGTSFKRWQKKMHFLLAGIRVAYVLTTPKPVARENETIAETRTRMKWEQDDYICKGHICNAMVDSLFDIYQSKSTAKDVWDALEAKYLLEDATSKKFLASKFMNYRMVDVRPVVEQFNEILHILSQFSQHNMKMDEEIAVSSIIDKLPPSWKDQKKILKHKKEEITVDQLGQHFQIEEELKIKENEEQVSLSLKVHMVEEGSSSKKPFQKKKQKKRTNFQNQNQNRDKKAKFTCYHCGKPGHFKKDCRFLKKKKQASDSKEFVTMISEIFMLEEDGSWWIDSCASRHVCKEMSLFKTFETMEDGCILFMGNSTTAAVKGKGTVNLEFTSGNVLTLTDVYYVPEIRKNLVSGGLLNKFGFKCVFESDQFVLTKGGTFVGKGYLSECVFKLNLVNKLNVSAYMIDSISLWHNRLGHVNTRNCMICLF
jgi:hypothetical protein